VGRDRRAHRKNRARAAMAGRPDSAAAMWEKVILPTLYDHAGKALVCSNSAGKNPDNFFYRLCSDSSYGFHEYHATTMDNPLLPKRADGERIEDWNLRRAHYQEALRRDNDPLVYAQEYLAQFVDWSGAAFSIEKSCSLKMSRFLIQFVATAYLRLSTPPRKPAPTTTGRRSHISRKILSARAGFSFWIGTSYRSRVRSWKYGSRQCSNVSKSSHGFAARAVVQSARLSRIRTLGLFSYSRLDDGICRRMRSIRS